MTEIAPAELTVAGAEVGELVAAANGDDQHAIGDAESGPSKAEILTRMDEVHAFTTQIASGYTHPALSVGLCSPVFLYP